MGSPVKAAPRPGTGGPGAGRRWLSGSRPGDEGAAADGADAWRGGPALEGVAQCCHVVERLALGPAEHAAGDLFGVAAVGGDGAAADAQDFHRRVVLEGVGQLVECGVGVLVFGRDQRLELGRPGLEPVGGGGVAQARGFAARGVNLGFLLVEIDVPGEVDLGAVRFPVPESVRQNAEALDLFRRKAKLYVDSGYTFATEADIEILARYAIAWSEYLDLVRSRRKILSQSYIPPEWHMIYSHERCDELNNQLRLDDLVKADGAVTRKSAELTRLEDRLYLNPLARIKTIPKKSMKAPETDPLTSAGFGAL